MNSHDAITVRRALDDIETVDLAGFPPREDPHIDVARQTADDWGVRKISQDPDLHLVQALYALERMEVALRLLLQYVDHTGTGPTGAEDQP